MKGSLTSLVDGPPCRSGSPDGTDPKLTLRPRPPCHTRATGDGDQRSATVTYARSPCRYPGPAFSLINQQTALPIFQAGAIPWHREALRGCNLGCSSPPCGAVQGRRIRRVGPVDRSGRPRPELLMRLGLACRHQGQESLTDFSRTDRTIPDYKRLPRTPGRTLTCRYGFRRTGWTLSIDLRIRRLCPPCTR